MSVSMTDMTIMNTVPFAALCVAVVGCIWDLRSRRIPNVLTFGAAAAAFAYHLTTGGVGALGQSALGWLVGVLVFIVPFALRGLGGGDVKLVAALGAWIGWADDSFMAGGVIWLALYTAIAGGGMGIGVSMAFGYSRIGLRNVRLLLCHWGVLGCAALAASQLA